MQNNSERLQMQENSQKKVGVVIPMYNVAPYLRECLDSVINQTHQNMSVVLVHDGSTDNGECLQIAKEYVAKDSRFILFDKENGGLSSARNVGIEWFSGKYEIQRDTDEVLCDCNHCAPLDANNIQSPNDIVSTQHFIDSDMTMGGG